MVQFRPSSNYNSPFWTTNSGAPVWNNNASFTVGSRGNWRPLFLAWLITFVASVSLPLYLVGLCSTCLSSSKTWCFRNLLVDEETSCSDGFVVITDGKYVICFWTVCQSWKCKGPNIGCHNCNSNNQLIGHVSWSNIIIFFL